MECAGYRSLERPANHSKIRETRKSMFGRSMMETNGNLCAPPWCGVSFGWSLREFSLVELVAERSGEENAWSFGYGLNEGI